MKMYLKEVHIYQILNLELFAHEYWSLILDVTLENKARFSSLTSVKTFKGPLQHNTWNYLFQSFLNVPHAKKNSIFYKIKIQIFPILETFLKVWRNIKILLFITLTNNA